MVDGGGLEIRWVSSPVGSNPTPCVSRDGVMANIVQLCVAPGSSPGPANYYEVINDMASSGYVYVKAPPGHPNVNGDGYICEHILVAENTLGRLLKADEVVHHINKKRNDNNPSNLMVFASQRDHALYHKGGDAQLIDGVWHTEPLHGKCLYCGVDYIREPKWKKFCCKQCSDNYFKRRKIISDDDLLEIIQVLNDTNGNFLSVSKKYNVSDNAIRHRLKRLGLPYHSRDYKSN